MKTGYGVDQSKYGTLEMVLTYRCLRPLLLLLLRLLLLLLLLLLLVLLLLLLLLPTAMALSPPTPRTVPHVQCFQL